MNWVIIGSDNGLSPVRCQAVIWTNAGILLIGPLETNFSAILIGISNVFIHENPFENVVWEMATILSWPQCVKIHCRSAKPKYFPPYKTMELNYLFMPYLQCATINTLRPRKMAAIFQTTFWNAFSSMKMYEFWLKFHWNLFLGVQLAIFHHWVR